MLSRAVPDKKGPLHQWNCLVPRPLAVTPEPHSEPSSRCSRERIAHTR
jgi:hypothetical protein